MPKEVLPRQSTKKFEDYILKLIISESKRHTMAHLDRSQMELLDSAENQVNEEHVFVFNYDQVFSYDEILTGQLNEIATLKESVTNAVNTKLRVRQAQGVLNDAGFSKTRYIAFFINDSEPLPIDMSQ